MLQLVVAGPLTRTGLLTSTKVLLPIWPALFTPHAHNVPSPRMPNVYPVPADTAAQELVPTWMGLLEKMGTPVWPDVLSPQP